MSIKSKLSWLYSNIKSGLKSGIGLFSGVYKVLRKTKLAGVYLDDKGVVHADLTLDEGRVRISSDTSFSLTLGNRSITYNPEQNQIVVQL